MVCRAFRARAPVTAASSSSIPRPPSFPCPRPPPPTTLPPPPMPMEPSPRSSKQAAARVPRVLAVLAGNGDLVLLDVFGSPYAQHVRIALAEKGLAYERAEEDLAAKSDLLRRSNPVHGKVPVLQLDEAFPATSPLLPVAAGPDAAYARAGARFWADYAGRAHLCGKRPWLRPGGVDAEPEPEARAEMLAVLRALDAELAGREFFARDAFGYVDVAAMPFVAWFLTYERHGRFAVAEEREIW